MYDNINMCIDVMIQYVGQGTEGPTIPPFVFRGYVCYMNVINMIGKQVPGTYINPYPYE
jgi:hypothetical protein